MTFSFACLLFALLVFPHPDLGLYGWLGLIALWSWNFVIPFFSAFFPSFIRSYRAARAS